MRCRVSGVVSFIWMDSGRPRYARIPKDEVRTIHIRRNMICVGLSPNTSHNEIEIPFDGSDDSDPDDLEDIGPWPLDNVPGSGYPSPVVSRSYSHAEWCDKMFDALTSSDDADATFRWVAGTWEYTEGRPQ